MTVEDVGEELGVDESEAGRVIAGLLDLRLLHQDPDGGLLAALAPDSAQLRLLGPLVREISVMQEQVDRIRADLGSLLPVYRDEAGSAAGQIEVVHDLDVVLTLIGEFSARAETEVLTSQPGGGRPVEQLEDALTFAQELLGRGVLMRTLYQHTAQFNQGTVAYVEHVSGLGGEVRTTAHGFTRMLVFDRRVAVLALKEHPQGAVVVRNDNVVDTLVDAFERTWNGARPFPLLYSKRQIVHVSSEVKEAIMHLLVAGESDKKIAARVGLSLRTCQRHIADLMQELGARNRLHAGYLLHEQLAEGETDGFK
ncbi:LuxR C-terminal-related transcriptional regulator [Streptomyces sp. NPDC005279]|uniref:helix-turn-helix transcriptional regulator n=1 Tax=Streptomyces sp. NPDC005279 TaxID=3364712 RepID=UPI0036B67608